MSMPLKESRIFFLIELKTERICKGLTIFFVGVHDAKFNKAPSSINTFCANKISLLRRV